MERVDQSCYLYLIFSSYSFSTGCSLTLRLSGDWQEQFEFRRQLILGVQSIGEVDSSDSAVSMDLDPESLYVVGTVGSTGEI